MIKPFVLAALITFQGLFALDLTYKTESEHATIFSSESDQPSMASLLREIEEFYPTLCNDFDCELSNKLTIIVYPDLRSFHDAIHLRRAPDWLIIHWGNGKIQLASPSNPGPYHSSETVRKALLKSVAASFITQKYGFSCAPYWFTSGITGNKVNWPAYTKPSRKPSIADLDRMDYKALAEKRLTFTSISIVRYIEQRYGWEAILKILEDYSNFERVLGISKEELIDRWWNLIQGPQITI